MSEAATEAEARDHARHHFLAGRLTRTTDDRVIAGVGGGVGAALGVSPAYVRAALISLIFAGGAGLIIYLLLWFTVPDDKHNGSTITAEKPATNRQLFGLALAFLAAMVFLDAIDLWFGGLVWPATLLVFGGALVWERSSKESRGRLSGLASAGTPRSRTQIIIGASLMAAGVIVILTSLESFQSLGPVAIAVLLTAVGFMLVFGPWVLGLFGDLIKERHARIRSEERGEMAAHLHDSVLQTLALIQRSDDPQQMTTLARAQERDLRTWLFAPEREDGRETVGEAVNAAAARVEASFNVPVEVVVVGDRLAESGSAALIAAAAEAMANAAQHSEAKHVSVYVECREAVVEAWITDQGKGFDLDAVDGDRRGISESIIARMQRSGGSAEITSRPGEGTEVHLRSAEP